VPLHRAFSAGDQVRVTAGAWRDWIVRLDAIDERGAQASVPILGRHAQAVLPLEWLEAA
jgi:transcription antitermination factor NusG